MNLAPPIPRLGLPGRERELTPAEQRKTANRQPARTRTGSVVQRERHQADYVILVVVVALTAVGILMVYSSSAIRGYLSNEDTFATVGPQIQWAVLGILAMVVMMKVDYRYLRLVSVPFYIVAVALLILVFVPQFNRVVGGSARWLELPLLPAIHPAEIAKLAMVIYLAHWFAKRGTKVRSFWGGTLAFMIIVAPIVVLVFKEPDLGTTMVIGLTAMTMFFVAGANLVHLGAMVARGAPGRDLRGPARLPDGADPLLARPLVRPARRRASTRSRASSRSASAGCWGPGSGRASSRCPTPSTTSSSPRSARSSGCWGPASSSVLFLALAYSGMRVALARA